MWIFATAEVTIAETNLGSKGFPKTKFSPEDISSFLKSENPKNLLLLHPDHHHVKE